MLLTVQGCGGGGVSSDNPADTGGPVANDNPGGDTSNTYTGSESQVVVNETNAKDLAITAASGVKRALVRIRVRTAWRKAEIIYHRIEYLYKRELFINRVLLMR